jgi:hypothetical protein
LSERIDRKNARSNGPLVLPGLLVYPATILIRRDPNNDLAARVSDLTKVVCSHAASMIQVWENTGGSLGFQWHGRKSAVWQPDSGQRR